jgi:hypothetical protein
MRVLVRLILPMVVSLGVVLGTGYAATRLLADPDGEEKSVLDLICSYEDMVALDGELEEQRVLMDHCADVKRQTARDLIAGRITLHDAADVFSRLHQDMPENVALKHTRFPGRTEEERRSREVLAWVRAEQHLPPGQTDDVTCRLEAELFQAVDEGDEQAAE